MNERGRRNESLLYTAGGLITGLVIGALVCRTRQSRQSEDQDDVVTESQSLKAGKHTRLPTPSPMLFHNKSDHRTEELEQKRNVLLAQDSDHLSRMCKLAVEELKWAAKKFAEQPALIHDDRFSFLKQCKMINLEEMTKGVHFEGASHDKVDESPSRARIMKDDKVIDNILDEQIHDEMLKFNKV